VLRGAVEVEVGKIILREVDGFPLVGEVSLIAVAKVVEDDAPRRCRSVFLRASAKAATPKSVIRTWARGA
jgi:hypothetical protein